MPRNQLQSLGATILPLGYICRTTRRIDCRLVWSGISHKTRLYQPYIKTLVLYDMPSEDHTTQKDEVTVQGQIFTHALGGLHTLKGRTQCVIKLFYCVFLLSTHIVKSHFSSSGPIRPDKLLSWGSVCLSICLSVCLSVRLSINVSHKSLLLDPTVVNRVWFRLFYLINLTNGHIAATRIVTINKWAIYNHRMSYLQAHWACLYFQEPLHIDFDRFLND